MNRLLLLGAFCLSVTSLALSAWMFVQADARAAGAAETALANRERQLVEKWQPHVVEMCRQFDAPPPNDPRTFDELFKPVVRLVEKLNSTN